MTKDRHSDLTVNELSGLDSPKSVFDLKFLYYVVCLNEAFTLCLSSKAAYCDKGQSV